MAEPNSPWLVPIDESRESSLYLLEQEEKEYNSKLLSIATKPAPNPIGLTHGSGGGAGGRSSGIPPSSTTSAAGHNYSFHGMSPIARERGQSAGGTGSNNDVTAAVAAPTIATSAGRRTSTASTSSHGQRRRTSGSMRTFTPRPSPHHTAVGAMPSSIPSHHMSSSSSRMMMTSPRSTRPSRIARFSSGGSGVGLVRSHEESFAAEFSMDEDHPIQRRI